MSGPAWVANLLCAMRQTPCRGPDLSLHGCQMGLWGHIRSGLLPGLNMIQLCSRFLRVDPWQDCKDLPLSPRSGTDGAFPHGLG